MGRGKKYQPGETAERIGAGELELKRLLPNLSLDNLVLGGLASGNVWSAPLCKRRFTSDTERFA